MNIAGAGLPMTSGVTPVAVARAATIGRTGEESGRGRIAGVRVRGDQARSPGDGSHGDRKPAVVDGRIEPDDRPRRTPAPAARPLRQRRRLLPSSPRDPPPQLGLHPVGPDREDGARTSGACRRRCSIVAEVEVTISSARLDAHIREPVDIGLTGRPSSCSSRTERPRRGRGGSRRAPARPEPARGPDRRRRRGRRSRVAPARAGCSCAPDDRGLIGTNCARVLSRAIRGSMMPLILRQVPIAPSAPRRRDILRQSAPPNGVEETDAEEPQLDDGRAGHPDADPGGVKCQPAETITKPRFTAHDNRSKTSPNDTYVCLVQHLFIILGSAHNSSSSPKDPPRSKNAATLQPISIWVMNESQQSKSANANHTAKPRLLHPKLNWNQTSKNLYR